MGAPEAVHEKERFIMLALEKRYRSICVLHVWEVGVRSFPFEGTPEFLSAFRLFRFSGLADPMFLWDERTEAAMVGFVFEHVGFAALGELGVEELAVSEIFVAAAFEEFGERFDIDEDALLPGVGAIEIGTCGVRIESAKDRRSGGSANRRGAGAVAKGDGLFLKGVQVRYTGPWVGIIEAVVVHVVHDDHEHIGTLVIGLGRKGRGRREGGRESESLDQAKLGYWDIHLGGIKRKTAMHRKDDVG